MEGINITYINSTMNEVNELTTELYEEMCDNNPEEVVKIIDKLQTALKDIRKSYNLQS